MRRLEIIAPARLEWVERPDVQLTADDDVIVRPIASSTCDLDRAIIAGITPFRFPFAVGHEGVGEVVDCGPGVQGVRPGDLVVIPWHIWCGDCDRCTAGMPSHCRNVPRRAMYGIPLGGDWGGLFDDLIRSPWGGRALIPIPPGVSARAAASAGDNLTDAWRSVAPTLAAKPDASVLIAGGLPSVGVFVAMHAAALGAGRMLYVDPDPNRRQFVTTLGIETRPELPGPGEAEFDLVVDAGANPRQLADALALVAPGGRCHSVGIYFGDRTEMPLLTMFMNGTTFTTGRADVGHSIPQVLDLILTGAIGPLPIYSHEIAWDDAPTALAESPDKPIVERERLLAPPAIDLPE